MTTFDTNVLCIGLGGFGVNQIKHLAAQEKQDGVTYMVFDSSDSNMLDIDESGKTGIDIFMRVPNLDGGGKDRSKVYKPAVDFISQSLPKIPTAKITILVSSLSGGTGSVLSPLLNHHLKQRGSNVICIALATSKSLDETRNTFNTLTSLANQATNSGVPTHILLEEDNGKINRSVLDEAIRHHIVQIARIANTCHDGLDTADITNWLNHQRNGVAAGLTLVERFDDVEVLKEVEGAINILSLVKNADTIIPDIGVLNNALGVVADQGKDMHFISTLVGMDNFKRMLEERLKHFEGLTKALGGSQVFGNAQNASDDGLVL